MFFLCIPKNTIFVSYLTNKSNICSFHPAPSPKAYSGAAPHSRQWGSLLQPVGLDIFKKICYNIKKDLR